MSISSHIDRRRFLTVGAKTVAGVTALTLTQKSIFAASPSFTTLMAIGFARNTKLRAATCFTVIASWYLVWKLMSAGLALLS